MDGLDGPDQLFVVGAVLLFVKVGHKNKGKFFAYLCGADRVLSCDKPGVIPDGDKAQHRREGSQDDENDPCGFHGCHYNGFPGREQQNPVDSPGRGHKMRTCQAVHRRILGMKKPPAFGLPEVMLLLPLMGFPQQADQLYFLFLAASDFFFRFTLGFS